jgi:hypothetical protein
MIVLASIKKHDARPFNLYPFFSFEKMGAFATLKKEGRIQPEFFQGVNLRKS